MTGAAPAAQGPVWWRTPAGREGLAVGLVGLYGVSAGALGVAAGLSVWQTVMTSLLIFSGGSQFALYGVIGAGGGPLAAVATSTLLGLRNGFYGLELSRLLRPGRRLLPVNAHLTIDESTAVALAQEDPQQSRIGFWTTGIALFVVWQTTTVVGALAGEAMGDPRAYGLDAAAAAAFVSSRCPGSTASCRCSPWRCSRPWSSPRASCPRGCPRSTPGRPASRWPSSRCCCARPSSSSSRWRR